MRLAGVSQVYTHGQNMESLREEVGKKATLPHAESPKQLARQLARTANVGDVILIKGSHRGTGMRDVAPELRRAIRQRNGRADQWAQATKRKRLRNRVQRILKRR